MKKWIFLICCLLVSGTLTVQAEGTKGETQKETEEKIVKELDLDSVDDLLEELFPDKSITFSDLFTGLMSGDTKFSFALIKEAVKHQFLGNFAEHKKSMIQILVLVIIAAVFTNFSNVFQNKQVSQVSFYVVYILLVTISIGTFRMLVDTATNNLLQLVSFMKVLSPIYFLATAFATGSITSVAFYNIILVLIFLVELFVLNILVPLIQVYLVIQMLNNLATEDYLSKFAELLSTVISWTMKTILAAIIGINVIQALLGPAIDTLKRHVVTKGAGAIPLIGDAIGGVTDIVLGTALVIKNGIGMAGAIVCVLISIVPMVQIALVTLLYKTVCAVIQPISDKRVVQCISSMADGASMLLRVVFTTGVLFLLTIAIVAATAGG